MRNNLNRTLASSSIAAVLLQVEVSCPSGWTLTDCSAVSQGSAILGPVANGNRCHVRGAIGEDGVVGIAVCCRVRPPKQATTTLQWSGVTAVEPWEPLWLRHFCILTPFIWRHSSHQLFTESTSVKLSLCVSVVGVVCDIYILSWWSLRCWLCILLGILKPYDMQFVKCNQIFLYLFT